MTTSQQDTVSRPSVFDWIGEGRRLRPTKMEELALGVVGLGLSIYLTIYSIFLPVDSHFVATVLFAVLLPATFWSTTASARIGRRTIIDWVLIAASLAVGIYFVANRTFYAEVIVGLTRISPTEQAVCLVAIALSVEACRRSVGFGLALIVVVLLAYVAFGQYLPPPLHHAPIDLPYFTLMQTVTTYGLFGAPIEVAATYVFMFVLFGSLYHRSGGGQLFFDLAAAIAGRTTGGGSKACVISSACYGSISGSPVADVVTTGPLTIRLMLSTGVARERAGAIEAAASSGSAVLPPVMGAVAFIMVEFTSIPYHQIALASLLPALIYYGSILLYVDFQARQHGEGQIDASMIRPLGKALVEHWTNILPIAVLVTLLAQGYTVPYVAAGSAVAAVVSSWFSRFKENRIGPRALVECCSETMLRMTGLVAAVLAAGIITGSIELAGLTGKFSLLLGILSGDTLFGALVASAIVLVLFGMGMPTPGVYVLGAALLAPVLISRFGIPVFETHLFILFYACLSAITPPVAVACFAAATISGGNPMRIGLIACRIAAVGFMIPFFFVFNPGVLLKGDVVTVGLDVAAAILMAAAIVISLQGTYFGRPIGGLLRVLLALISIAFIVPVAWVQLTATGALLTVIAIMQRRGPVAGTVARRDDVAA